MDISFICEKAGTGKLNAIRTTAATIIDMEYFALMPRPPFLLLLLLISLFYSEDLIPLFLLARAFFGWFAATDAYAVLDRHAACLAWLTSTGLAHRNLLDSRLC